jgi:hypothetical protein
MWVLYLLITIESIILFSAEVTRKLSRKFADSDSVSADLSVRTKTGLSYISITIE